MSFFSCPFFFLFFFSSYPLIKEENRCFKPGPIYISFLEEGA